MTAEQVKPAHGAMEGSGFYNRNSSMQAAGIALVLPLWESVASTVPVGDEPLAIADYAAAQGRNSFAPMLGWLAFGAPMTTWDQPARAPHQFIPSRRRLTFSAAIQSIFPRSTPASLSK